MNHIIVHLFSDKPVDEVRLRWQIQVKKMLINLQKKMFPIIDWLLLPIKTALLLTLIYEGSIFSNLLIL